MPVFRYETLGIAGKLCLVATALAAAGCSNRPPNPQTADVVFFVPGAAGDGRHYDGLIRGLRLGGVDSRIEVLTWGAPGPLMPLNFQDNGIHRRAEEKLAAALADWAKAHPGAEIDLVGHSAGCGVILGALKRPNAPAAHTVVLLNPSVSPGYDLRPALEKAEDRVHVFHSDKDTVFLSWRTGTFGTYDNVRTKAAGNTGFTGTDRMPPALSGKLAQYPHDAADVEKGNDGGHFGSTHERFARQTLAPLLRGDAGRK